MSSDVVAPSLVFRSVLRPGLVLDRDDVFLCPDCGEESSREYEEIRAQWGDCSTCRGYRLLHGFGPGGIGLPVVVEDGTRLPRPAA